jgi:hypothetical protein
MKDLTKTAQKSKLCWWISLKSKFPLNIGRWRTWQKLRKSRAWMGFSGVGLEIGSYNWAELRKTQLKTRCRLWWFRAGDLQSTCLKMKASATKTKPEKEKKNPQKWKAPTTKSSFTNAVRSCWELEQKSQNLTTAMQPRKLQGLWWGLLFWAL